MGAERSAPDCFEEGRIDELSKARLLRRAERHIDAILRYRFERAGAAGAEQLRGKFEEAFRLLARRPRIGSKKPRLTSRPFLFWLVEEYWIVYLLRGAPPVPIVTHVLDTRRNVTQLLR
jgi:plasmid stabilization system protein ParE